MSKAEETRKFIIQKSAPIFNKKGYGSTSLSDIQEATKLTKGAIYGNFSDKSELAVSTYEYSFALILDRITEEIKKTATAKEALLAYIHYYVTNWQTVFKIGGCPMLNAAVEADDHLLFLRDTVRRSFRVFIGLLQGIIIKGKVNGEFNANVNPAEYAALIHSVVEGNILLAKIMDDPEYFHIAANHIDRIIDQQLT